jgi:hypothetical protein
MEYVLDTETLLKILELLNKYFWFWNLPSLNIRSQQ